MRKLIPSSVLLLGLVLVAVVEIGDRAPTGASAEPSAGRAGAGVTVDEARATDIAAAAFESFNAGDYTGWSRDWSDTMRSAISEEAFQGWRSSVIEQLGTFVSLQPPTWSSRQPGTYRWSFPVTFERGSVSIGIGFSEGRDQVEGVFVEA